MLRGGGRRKGPLKVCPSDMEFSFSKVISAADSKSLSDLDLLFKGLE
jgi:hypothetical protein